MASRSPISLASSSSGVRARATRRPCRSLAKPPIRLPMGARLATIRALPTPPPPRSMRLSLNIAFQEGLYFLTEKGQKEDNVSHVQYRYRPSAAAIPTGARSMWPRPGPVSCGLPFAARVSLGPSMTSSSALPGARIMQRAAGQVAGHAGKRHGDSAQYATPIPIRPCWACGPWPPMRSRGPCPNITVARLWAHRARGQLQCAGNLVG